MGYNTAGDDILGDTKKEVSNNFIWPYFILFQIGKISIDKESKNP